MCRQAYIKHPPLVNPNGLAARVLNAGDFLRVDMQPYTYYLYHKPTGRHYYGVRTATGCHPNELWVTYFSSSKIVNSLREQFGNESFYFEIRKLFEKSEDALEWERKVLTRIDAAGREDWLNRHNGGNKFTTKNQSPWNKGLFLSTEHIEKLRISHTGKPLPESAKKKLSDYWMGISKPKSKNHIEKLKKASLGNSNARKKLTTTNYFRTCSACKNFVYHQTNTQLKKALKRTSLCRKCAHFRNRR